MAKIYLVGDQDGYELNDSKATNLKADWEAGRLPMVVSISEAISFRRDKIVKIVINEEMSDQDIFFAEDELRRADSELEPYREEGKSWDDRVMRYLSLEARNKYLSDKGVASKEGTPLWGKAIEYHRFCRLISKVADWRQMKLDHQKVDKEALQSIKEPLEEKFNW